ncbi:hypothetical protein OHV05_30600 [Kitasatospora sp. NBC_00070]|uniref:hypothetical protein n=1 Tax=Kitasatospora sp. NBC_00070 TaxID=2975962 RepID=UPI00324670CC
MTFFRRRSRDRSVPPAVDPACGNETLALMLRQAEAGDWPALCAGLAAVGDPSELTWLVAGVSNVAGTEEGLAKAVADRPDSALPLLLSGARQISWAWEARTRAQAQHVSQEQWRVFGERLEVAEQQLFEVAEREPDWLAPWYFLQISGRGASLDKEAGRIRFEAALRRCPGHLDSHKQRLQQLCAKWGGSHQQMHAFARESMLAAPPGSPLGELVVLGHLERWLDLPSGADHSYLTSPDVLAELHEALGRSILHPDYVRPAGWQSAYNTFAMVFALVGEKWTARQLFEAIGPTVTESPWHYLSGDDPATTFTALRERCAK